MIRGEDCKIQFWVANAMGLRRVCLLGSKSGVVEGGWQKDAGQKVGFLGFYRRERREEIEADEWRIA